MEYATLVKELRESLLLTQEEFAKKINVSPVTICRWETGISKPSIKAKRKIKALYDNGLLCEKKAGGQIYE